MTSHDSGAERIPAKLINACRYGKLTLLQDLLNEAREANKLDDNTLRICIQKASERGNEPVARILLANNAKTDIVIEKGLPPLTRAVQRNQINVVRLLLQHKADPEATNSEGRTCLTDAALRNHLEIVELLLTYNANINAQDRNYQNVLHVLAADEASDTEVYMEALGKATKKHGRIPRWGTEMVQLLLRTNIDVELQDDRGRTPLHWAAITGKEDFLSLLLTRPQGPRANVHACNHRRKTALHLAAESGHLETCRLLLDYGANVMAKSDGAWTPLHNAAEKGHSSVVQMLLTKGANINATTSSGMTALHWASHNGHLATVETLVNDSRAHLNPRDAFESTPLLRAAQYQRKEVVRYLAHHIFSDRLLSSDAIDACRGFRGAVVDFEAGVERRKVVEKKSVYEIVYKKDSKDPDQDKYAVTTLTQNIRSKPHFRWIHLPANNMAWVEALITKHFLENGATDVEGFKALERSFVQSHQGPSVHSRFMR